jgi:hypothetical protein
MNNLIKMVYIGEDQRILERYKIYDLVYTEFSYYLLKVVGIPYGVYKKDCIPLEEWRDMRIIKILND